MADSKSTSRTTPSPSLSHAPRRDRRRADIFRERRKKEGRSNPRQFNYDLDFRTLDLRERPELYRVGVGEQGVLLVQPYKSEILPHWRFKTPDEALRSARAIWALFEDYRDSGDFIGMDMARKFIQMGFTRARRYANHSTGRKYSLEGNVLPFKNDPVKAESAKIFKRYWEQVEADPVYAHLKRLWKTQLG